MVKLPRDGLDCRFVTSSSSCNNGLIVGGIHVFSSTYINAKSFVTVLEGGLWCFGHEKNFKLLLTLVDVFEGKTDFTLVDANNLHRQKVCIW